MRLRDCFSQPPYLPGPTTALPAPCFSQSLKLLHCGGQQQREGKAVSPKELDVPEENKTKHSRQRAAPGSFMSGFQDLFQGEKLLQNQDSPVVLETQTQ